MFVINALKLTFFKKGVIVTGEFRVKNMEYFGVQNNTVLVKIVYMHGTPHEWVKGLLVSNT